MAFLKELVVEKPGTGKGRWLQRKEEMREFLLPKQSLGISHYQLDVLTMAEITNAQLFLQGTVGENHHLQRGMK